MPKSNKSTILSKSVKTELDKFETKSSQIRHLDSKEYSRSEISKILTEYYGKLVRYQHVRNVLITPIKKK